jgi:hypothetical protein
VKIFWFAYNYTTNLMLVVAGVVCAFLPVLIVACATFCYLERRMDACGAKAKRRSRGL